MSVTSTLKYINALPFPLTLRHYVDLGPSAQTLSGKMRSGRDWMVLRNQHPRYRIPDTRDAWLADLRLDSTKDGQDPALLERVDSFAKLLTKHKIETVFSVGSGAGVFEYYLKTRHPAIKIIATEYENEAVVRLRKVFPEADAIEQFDALDPRQWERVAKLPHAIVFIYRNEREFSNREWREIFSSMHAAGVEHVFLGLMWTLTLRALLARAARNTRSRIAGGRIIFAGYIRSFVALEKLWNGTYTIREEIYFPTCRGLYLIRINQSQ